MSTMFFVYRVFQGDFLSFPRVKRRIGFLLVFCLWSLCVIVWPLTFILLLTGARLKFTVKNDALSVKAKKD